MEILKIYHHLKEKENLIKGIPQILILKEKENLIKGNPHFENLKSEIMKL